MSKTPVVLRSLKRLVEPQAEVVAMCDNSVSFLDAIDDLEPDVTVVDVGSEPLSFVAHLLARRSGLALIALVMDVEPHLLRQLREAGVGGVVDKGEVAHQLAPAIRAVVNGDFFTPPLAPHSS